MTRKPNFTGATDVLRFVASETGELAARETITDTQRACLRELRSGPRSLWEYGSTTINRLRRMNYITTVGGFAQLTDDGRREANK